jgi:hypothetical protein
MVHPPRPPGNRPGGESSPPDDESGRTTRTHVCDDACGITRDRDCPIWYVPPPPAHGSPALLDRISRGQCTPEERATHRGAVELADRLKAAGYVVGPAILELIRDGVEEVVRDVLRQELPPILTALLKRGGGRR